MSEGPSKWFRQLTSTFILLLLLIVLLGFYYLKYIPDRRNDLNRAAFLELNQLKSAIQYKDQAYREAFGNAVQEEQIREANKLSGPDGANNKKHRHAKKTADTAVSVDPTLIIQNDSSQSWQLIYPIVNKINSRIDSKSVDISPIMSDLVSAYKDIFDGYLLIRDLQSPEDTSEEVNISQKESKEKKQHEAQVIYQTSGISIDYLIDLDSLLKKDDGFSLKNPLDVTVEGNPYKLFIYPFQIGDQKLLLTGLIARSHYNNTYEQIPFSFFTIFLVLFLLLIIHVPILKIYILGPKERIRDGDIRLIIGSYFIAAFFGFFLMSKSFLDKVQSFQNKTRICNLSVQIKENLQNELVAIDNQLTSLDSALGRMKASRDTSLPALTTETDILGYKTKKIDSLLKPQIYPFLDFVYWIDSNGKWDARWSFKNTFTHSPLIDVSDRRYFKDFMKNKALSIEGIHDSINIQPTLSKLEGTYTVSIVKKSGVSNYSFMQVKPSGSLPNKKDGTKLRLQVTPDALRPKLIGLSSEMHSISHVLMPPGYGFSIIDESGDIQFDCKAGRPLLSNILKDLGNPAAIQQTVLYRNNRYFDQVMLRGKKMALLSTPINGTPYQLLVYFNLSRIDGFNEHLVGFAVLLMGCVIGLLILSSLVNQWSKTKLRILESRSRHFEWLHPSTIAIKQKFYWHLITWMGILFGIYLLFWIVIEVSPLHRSEFSLFFISLLFPFYIAIHYFELRERYYDVKENRIGVLWYFSQPSLLLRGLLLFIIIVINSFTALGKFSLQWPVILIQFAWAAAITWSAYRFKKNLKSICIPDQNKTSDPLTPPAGKNPEFPEPLVDFEKGPSYHNRQINPYILSILIGVMMISIIPACSIFWVLFRQATILNYQSDRLSMAMQIDARRNEINNRLGNYKLIQGDPGQLDSIRNLKFNHGIYLLNGRILSNDSGAKYKPLNFPGREYIKMHRQFFDEDSAVLAWSGMADSAADGSWYFAEPDAQKRGTKLVYRNRNDVVNTNSFMLTAGGISDEKNHRVTFWGLVVDNKIFFILLLVCSCFALALAYFLTRSLARRLFLLNLKKADKPDQKISDEMTECYDNLVDRGLLKEVMLKTYSRFEMSPMSKHELDLAQKNPEYPEIKDVYFFERVLPLSLLEENILGDMKIMDRCYQALWQNLTKLQKFLLYDFAQDGFSNYKAEKDLRQLMKMGLIFFDDLRLTAVTLSFQEYILLKKDDPDINVFMATAVKEDTWKKLKNPLLILLACVGVFIFFTQDAVYQKITGLLTSVTSLLPLLTNLFNPKGNGKSGSS
jgi:hypothetical protein